MDESKVINKLLKFDDRLERIEVSMLKKEDGEKITTALDQIIKIVNRLDQERIFTTEWVKRIESDAEKQHREIEKIKQVLKIS